MLIAKVPDHDRIAKINKLVASKQRKKRQLSFRKLLLLLITNISINPLQTKRLKIHETRVREGALSQGSPSFYISQESRAAHTE